MSAPWETAHRRWYAPLLPIAAWGYGVGVWLDRMRHTVGLRKVHRVDVPVLCVGNITVGGTGKTPAVIALCRTLLEMGRRPAVLSRGYRGERDDSAAPLRVDPEAGDWRETGDEPLLIARTLPGVPVFVGSDRVASAHASLALDVGERPDVLVLDDGFQHWRLARDLDIVLLDGTDPFGNGKLLPRGPLREPIAALQRAGCIVLTKVNLAHEAGVWAQRLGNRLNPPVIQATHRPVATLDLHTGESHALEALRGKRVVAVSGIARNETFPALLRSLGALVEATLGFEDHQAYGPDQWTAIRQIFHDSQAEMLITTAKDAVKWTRADIGGLPVQVLEIAFEPALGTEKLHTALRGVLAER